MLLVVALALAAQAQPAQPAYRVGTATNRIAILPVRCERDLDPSLCAALGESIAVEVGHDPRIDVVNPRDIDVLLGAQTVADLSSCDKDDCFSRQDFTRIDAAYLISLAVNRIGDEARLVVRIVDLKRGAVIDRDQAAAPAHDERAIERASRDLVMSVLVRRGLARPPTEAAEERGLGPLFWVGLVSSVTGAGAAVGGGVLDIGAVTATSQLVDDAGASAVTRAQFDKRAAAARTSALEGDMLVGAGAALVVGGGIMMIVGAL
jgi:hypothetical protein